MEEYVKWWLEILEGMQNSNTYKLAFGLGVLECIDLRKYKEDEEVHVSLLDIGDCMIRYYWNQCFYFDLKQQPGDKVPTIYQGVQALIDEYKELTMSEIPVWSDRGLAFLKGANPEFLKKVRFKVARTIPENVGWRFKNVGGEIKDIYRFDKEKDTALHFKKEDVKVLQEYIPILSKLLDYKWSQLLEKWNESPRLLGKVAGASSQCIHRHSLTKFKKPLSLEFQDGPIRDFYTGEELAPEDISIDHVIPWSYIYSDDIWNLVFTSRSHNSRKSNHTPSEEDIERLKRRNEILVQKLNECMKKDLENFKEDLDECARSQLLERYYFGLRRSA